MKINLLTLLLIAGCFSYTSAGLIGDTVGAAGALTAGAVTGATDLAVGTTELALDTADSVLPPYGYYYGYYEDYPYYYEV